LGIVEPLFLDALKAEELSDPGPARSLEGVDG
jgi:hypothetical protein